MILKIELSNFYSIRDKICIDFRAANINTQLSRELSDNVMEWQGMQVLKSVGLFGPNASGKSNIIKSINFCCGLILTSINNNEGTIFNFVPFKFDGYDSKPSTFYVDFVMDGIEYEYSFSLSRQEILDEELYYYPKGRKARVFTRIKGRNPEYSFGESVLSRPKDIVMNTSNKNLFLTRASSMNRPIAQKVYGFFLQKFMLALVWGNNNVLEIYFNKYKSLILKALSICDTDIADIQILHGRDLNPASNGDMVMEQSVADNIRFITYHKENSSVPFDLLKEESDGTKNLFLILLSLLDVVKYNKSLMLDEFDSNLHIRLADFIIDLIHASTGSQLLFTSHSTNLIDIHRFRKDQIVFVNKRDDASTEVYSLYDYKDFRDNMDAEKAYIQGRFDAVPYVESSVASLKRFLKED